VTETCNPAIHLGPSVMGMDWGGIPEMRCDMAMAARLGIHIRRRGREPFHFKGGMCGHSVLDENSSVGVQPLPADAHRPGDGPRDMSQRHKTVRGPEGLRNMTRVHRAGSREAHHRGSRTACAHAPPDGRVPPRSPGRARLGATRHAGVIDEDECRASATSLLCMRAHSGVSQAWTKASSRARAETAGCGGLPPRG
jgi:hypothetical protein